MIALCNINSLDDILPLDIDTQQSRFWVLRADLLGSTTNNASLIDRFLLCDAQ